VPALRRNLFSRTLRGLALFLHFPAMLNLGFVPCRQDGSYQPSPCNNFSTSGAITLNFVSHSGVTSVKIFTKENCILLFPY
jgi:hypothetical protein